MVNTFTMKRQKKIGINLGFIAVLVVTITLFQLNGCVEEDTPPTTNPSSGPPAGGGSTGSGGGTTTPPTTTSPSTIFLSDECRNLTGLGSWFTQEFTTTSSRKFVLRFSSRYSADAAIITPAQLNSFRNNQSFSGFALFDNKFGYTTIDLAAGTYHLAVRNQISTANTTSLELDYDITLPTSDKATFVDVYINAVRTLEPGARMWQEFTIQKGYRYFLDGNNTGVDSFVIPASEIEKFKGAQSFQYYTDYSGTSCNEPGLYEVKLPEGTYFLCFRNSKDVPNSLNYFMERWRVN